MPDRPKPSGEVRFCRRSREARQKNFYMYFVYFIQSQTNGDLYIGSTEDVENRLRRHNAGRVKSTKPNKPWKLIGFKEFTTRSEAVRIEKFFKQHQQKEILKKEYGL